MKKGLWTAGQLTLAVVMAFLFAISVPAQGGTGGLVFSTYLGGSGDEPSFAKQGAAVDAAGNIYVTGGTTSTDFPATPGAYDTTSNGGSDVFVAKLDATGALVWSTYLGGSAGEQAHNIAVDGAGSVYITGDTSSTNFPTTPGAFDRKLDGGQDAFVAKLSGDGSTLLYSTYLGGRQIEYAWGVAVDASGNAYVAGRTESSNFPVTAGAYDTTYGGGADAFVTKINPIGSGLVYSTYLGGKEVDSASGMALDVYGNAYVAGLTSADSRGRNTFPTTPGAFDRTFNGATDIFLTKLNAAGTALLYSTYLGGSNQDNMYGLDIDNLGCVYVTGLTWSSNFPTTSGAFDTAFSGSNDAFVTKLNEEGSGLVYSTYFSGNLLDGTWGYAIAVDAGDAVMFTGKTMEEDLPVTPTAYDTTYNGHWDGFIAQLDPTGSSLLYCSYLGGSYIDYGYGVAVDGGGEAIVFGMTSSSDFPTTQYAYDTTYNGGEDAFAMKVDI